MSCGWGGGGGSEGEKEDDLATKTIQSAEHLCGEKAVVSRFVTTSWGLEYSFLVQVQSAE